MQELIDMIKTDAPPIFNLTGAEDRTPHELLCNTVRGALRKVYASDVHLETHLKSLQETDAPQLFQRILINLVLYLEKRKNAYNDLKKLREQTFHNLEAKQSAKTASIFGETIAIQRNKSQGVVVKWPTPEEVTSMIDDLKKLNLEKVQQKKFTHLIKYIFQQYPPIYNNVDALHMTMRATFFRDLNQAVSVAAGSVTADTSRAEANPSTFFELSQLQNEPYRRV